jgi:hypothetical protein
MADLSSDKVGTPRTDAACQDEPRGPSVNADFARQLEREQAEALDVINKALYPESGCKLDSLFVAASSLANERRVLEEALSKARSSIEPQPDDVMLMPRKLTAENGMKGAMIGEFSFKPHEDAEPVYVPWDTIKQIYDRAVTHLGRRAKPLSPPLYTEPK